ncbi:uncharacterized protein [Ptychodera flava]|uniref:uncharacterized protein n=1 Tax=Ptychodera flava TaxID=63121 RepID=UPI00396A71A2
MNLQLSLLICKVILTANSLGLPGKQRREDESFALRLNPYRAVTAVGDSIGDFQHEPGKVAVEEERATEHAVGAEGSLPSSEAMSRPEWHSEEIYHHNETKNDSLEAEGRSQLNPSRLSQEKDVQRRREGHQGRLNRESSDETTEDSNVREGKEQRGRSGRLRSKEGPKERGERVLNWQRWQLLNGRRQERGRGGGQRTPGPDHSWTPEEWMGELNDQVAENGSDLRGESSHFDPSKETTEPSVTNEFLGNGGDRTRGYDRPLRRPPNHARSSEETGKHGDRIRENGRWRSGEPTRPSPSEEISETSLADENMGKLGTRMRENDREGRIRPNDSRPSEETNKPSVTDGRMGKPGNRSRAIGRRWRARHYYSEPPEETNGTAEAEISREMRGGRMRGNRQKGKEGQRQASNTEGRRRPSYSSLSEETDQPIRNGGARVNANGRQWRGGAPRSEPSDQTDDTGNGRGGRLESSHSGPSDEATGNARGDGAII